MNSMNKAIGKMSAGFGRSVKGMKNASHNCKVDGEVSAQQSQIKALTMEIGRLTVRSLDQHKNLGPEILERYDAILAARTAIQEAEADRVVSRVICPRCGAKTLPGMRYCGTCGEEIAPLADAE